ncbi:MAG: response regulator [Thermodesulfovibrionales bacterium]
MDHQSQNVLIVDDNELLLFALQHYLEKDFHHVAAVTTGVKALTEIGRQFYGRVVLDVNLPDINGLDLMALIKQQSPDSSVFIMTSNDYDEVRDHAFQRGASGFFGKPFDIEKLKGVLTAPLV